MRLLGTSGIRVSELALGTMVLGAWGNRDHDECERIVHRALDAGINVVDTADVYAFGESEEIVGRALRDRRDDVVLATKFHNAMGEDPNHRGNSRRWITRAVEDSLRRLQTDRIDLYQVHRPDPDTDLDETMAALSDLVHAGKVLAVGTSTFPAEDLVDAWWRAETRGHVRFRSEQPPYSILARGVEASVLPTCQRLGLGVLVWSPLQGGWLTGKYRRGAPVPPGSRADTNPDHFDHGHSRKFDLVEALLALADEAGLPLAHLALGFVLAHPAVSCAIIGPRTLDQLEDLLGAGSVVLEADVLDRIDALVAPGETLNTRDEGWVPPALADPSLRRRSGPSTSASTSAP
jgi:aryl-alcohol dehydrogenase-like predicted oxidoreductase